MTHTETSSGGIPRETIETSMRRARRLRSRVIHRLMRRLVRSLSPARLQPGTAPDHRTLEPV